MDDQAQRLHASWRDKLGGQFGLPYFNNLCAFLDNEKEQGKVIYPSEADMFNAFNHTPFDQVKVVILGQDPYHGVGQAHGFSFSVKNGIAVPPSLKNIYKELQADIGMDIPHEGDLRSWADQGVLLLNAVLSVENAKAGSHQGRGWEAFTDEVISVLNTQKEGLVFLLWGSYAQKKGKLIDRNKHCVLQSSHPSPLSSYRGFFGCNHFSKTNAYLKESNQAEINWASVVNTRN